MTFRERAREVGKIALAILGFVFMAVVGFWEWQNMPIYW